MEPLRILMVGCSAVERMEQLLRSAGMAFVSMCVDGRAFQEESFAPDIILCDGGTDPLSILTAAKRSFPLTPLILIASESAPMDARQLLENGASDYVTMSDLARLPFAIDRSLAEARGRLVEQKLQESEEKFRSIAASAQDAVIMIDNKGCISFWNAAAQTIFGYSEKEAIGRELHPLLAPTRFQDEYRRGFAHFSASGEGAVIGKTLELIALRKDGTEFPIELSLSSLKLGGSWQAIGICRDISARKSGEDALCASNSLLRSIVENAPIRVFWKDTNLRFLGCNTAFARDAGMEKPEDLIGKDDFQLAWHDQAELYQADDRRVMESGTPKLGYEEPQTAQDDKTVWLRTSKVPLHDANGKVIGVLGIYEDITESKNAEDEREQYLKFFNASTELMGIADPNGAFKKVNPAFLDTLGYSESEVLAKPFIEFVHPDDRQSTLDEMKRQLDRGFSLNFENRYICKDGSARWLSWRATVDYEEGVTYASARDITERKLAEFSQKKLTRALTLIRWCNSILVHADEEARLLSDICRLAVETGGYLMAWVGFPEHDEDKTVRPVAEAGFEEGYLQNANISWADNERGRGPTGTAIRTGKIQVNQNFLANPAMIPWRESALQHGYQSSLAMPLTHEGSVLGSLTLYAREPDAFTAEETDLLLELAGDLAFGLAHLRMQKERDRAVLENRRYMEKLRESLEDALQAISATVEMRDPYTAGHQRRVAHLAVAIANEMGLSEEQSHGIHLAAIVHDIGKIHIPAEMLSKPGRLTEIEYSLIKIHPEAGYEILKEIDFPWPIAQAVLQHHERMDGSGYPRGLKDEEIIIEARILSVADVVEAISSHRPYRPGLGIEAALDELRKNRGVLYDPAIVDACFRLFQQKGYRFPLS
jgi:PAS domain S-box-containing protein/putative nucleotidyltransferase with HDIG domain